MPDYNEPIHAQPEQTDWPGMIHDLEKRIEVLSDALEDVRLVMRRMVLAEPWLPQANASQPPAVAVYEPAPVAPQPPAVVYDDDAREAVRRAVEDAKAQMASGDWRDEPSDFVNEEKPDVSWVTLPDDGSDPESLPVVEDAAPESEPAHEQDEDDEEEAREAVRRAVEELKAEMADPDASPEQFQPIEDEEAAREAVRRAVEEAKAEMGYGTQSYAPAAKPVDDEEVAREAVRRAVMQARNEMATTGSLSETPPEPVEVAPAYVVPPPHRPERMHPPTITIEDPEGRVELARVYNLLKALDCAANSSLLNYSSRQVSVQLSDNRVPDGVIVGEAVKDVFEREPEVQVDGLNVIVKLGHDYIRAA